MTTDDQSTTTPANDESLALARLAAVTADDKQGTDTIILPVGQVLSITEYFVITAASNRRLVRAIADEVESRVREVTGRAPGRVEGHREQQWVLLDYRSAYPFRGYSSVGRALPWHGRGQGFNSL